LEWIALPGQEQIDVAFRVIADHIRTLSFAIADGIQPGNTDRNYVLRRILRRAVRYGRTLGFHEPFFYKLVDVLADTMGDVFPEIRTKKKHVQEVIRVEEEAFNKTLDKGIELFDAYYTRTLTDAIRKSPNSNKIRVVYDSSNGKFESNPPGATQTIDLAANVSAQFASIKVSLPLFRGENAFELYDTYGFPLDLTELMARERGLTVDKEGFNKLMDEQKSRARAAQKKEIITINTQSTNFETEFIGYENLETKARVLSVLNLENKDGVVVDVSPFYAEMGGQVGDTGILIDPIGHRHVVKNTRTADKAFVLYTDLGGPNVGEEVILKVDVSRRNAIQRHHTVTHLLHWALHEVVNKEASQKGSFVGPDKLTFDFNSAPLSPQQVAEVEKLVNERILENAPVTWMDVKYNHVKDRKDVMQFFGEKYGEWVRVVQIGGKPTALDGYSMELCGGTHTRATGEIGLFRIVGESAIAAGVRRIEAIAGLEAYRKAADEMVLIKSLAGKVNSPVHELEKKIESLLEHQKVIEKQLKAAQQREASNAASLLLEEVKVIKGVPVIIHNLGAVDGDFLQLIADSLKGRFKGVVVLGGGEQRGNVALVAAVSPEFTAVIQAGKIIQQIAPIVGGKGGGKADNARGGGKDASKLDEALAKVKTLF
jgi:alanyl-tRNA synthetase